MTLFETAYSTFKGKRKILEINSLHKPPALGIGTLRNHEILTGSVEPLLFHRQSQWLMKGVRKQNAGCGIWPLDRRPPIADFFH